MRQFFQAPKTYAKVYGKENISNFMLKKFVYLNKKHAGRTDRQTDGRTTDRLWYEINIPFFLKKKKRV